MDFRGRIGACSVQKGFTYAVADKKGNHMKEAKAIISKESSIELAMKVKDNNK